MTSLTDFVIDAHPAAGDLQYLEDQINAFNVAQTGIAVADDVLLSILLRDATGAIRAGIYGWTWGGCCEIRILWVDASLRHQGYGQRLLAGAEEEARRRQCHQMILDTHSFQALAFYQRYGYELVGTIDDYPLGYQKHYLRKALG
jgi:GNAT superfamily N-acetyltransferase